jgi:hypothetical protein
MRTVQAAILCALVLASGCAHNATVLLERDLRLQEDKIYHLQCLLEQCESEHEATLRENEALKKELATGDRGPGPDSKGPSLEPPAAERKSRSRAPAETPKLEAPTIELPEPSSTPPDNLKPPSDSGAIREGKATQLVINKQLTGGLDRDGRAGDEGLLVVIEPRDSAGHLVRANGAVAVALMDPAEQGEASRVARWDFSAHEVQGHFHTTGFGRGLQFELPWPAAPPKNSALKLYVRFISDDGQKLNAELPIDVQPPQDLHTRSWSPSRGATTPRAPGSRVKSPNARSNTQNDRAEVDRYSDDEPAQRTTGRSDRPAWKPYR